MTIQYYTVVGGELVDVESETFRDPSNIETVGTFDNYDDAVRAWRGRAQATVDNALMRFFVLPLDEELSAIAFATGDGAEWEVQAELISILDAERAMVAEVRGK